MLPPLAAASILLAAVTGSCGAAAQEQAGLSAAMAGLQAAPQVSPGATRTHRHDPSESIVADSVGPAGLTLQQLKRGTCQTGAPAHPVVELTIGAAHAAMLAGRLNCSGLVAAYLQRIEAFDQCTHLNAIRAVNPAAAQRAAELDAELEAVRRNGSTQLPPLFCVPLLVKDNFDVAGMATTAGSMSMLDHQAAADSHVVGLLQQHGALVLAKTSMGEFAFFPSWCVSSVSGAVRNPYHLSYTPAGSSGGSAAATAANLGMVALGTDTGNSVRGPASHTALVGIRPSLGLTSRRGIVPLRLDRDTAGPMARTVEDAVRVLDGMGGADPSDPISQLLHNVSLPDTYTRFLDPAGLQGARIGVFRQISNLSGADAAIQDVFEVALSTLSQAGAELVDDFTIRGNRYGLDWDADRGGQGPALGHWNVGGRWEDLWACQSPFRVGLDAYLAEGNNASFPHSLADIYRSGAFHPEVEDEIMAALRANYSPESYPTPAMRAAGMLCGCSWFWTDPCRTEFRQRLIESMDELDLDAVVYPTWNKPPLKVGDQDGDGYDGNNSPLVAPHTGSPAITVPMGVSGEGLPVGLQFLGRPFDEASIIRLAYAYEQVSKQRNPPPLFPECVQPTDGQAAAAGRSQAGR